MSQRLVTWILAGVIMPVETDAGIVRRRKQVDEVSVSDRTSQIPRSPLRRAAGTHSCDSMKADESMERCVVAWCFSHLDTSAGEGRCA